MANLSSSSSSSITRPAYVQDLIDQVYNEVNNISPAQWIDKQYAGLNPDEQDAINNMSNSTAMDNFAKELMGLGSGGKSLIEDAWSGLEQMFQAGPITAQDITNEASNFYNQDAVNNAINSANNSIYSQTGNTMAQAAESTMNQNQGTFTSGAANQQSATLSNALSSMNSADSAITNQAYKSALGAATGVLTGQRKLQKGALSSMASIGSNMLNYAGQGANIATDAAKAQMKAGELEQMAQQAQDDMDYFNQKGAQNLPWLYIDQMLKAAGVFNSAEGTTTNTNSSTSVSGGGLF